MATLDPKNFSISKENKKDFKKSLIARSNLTNHFTLEEVEDDQKDLERTEREIKSQISLSTKALENVARNYPFTAKLSDEQLMTAAYVYETKSLLAKSEAKMKEIKNAKKKYKDVIALLYKKFNFVEPEDVTKK